MEIEKMFAITTLCMMSAREAPRHEHASCPILNHINLTKMCILFK